MIRELPCWAYIPSSAAIASRILRQLPAMVLESELDVTRLAIMDAASKSERGRLNLISDQLSNIYEMSRSTSHNWYHGFGHNSEKSLAAQIQDLADSALPDTIYNKSIVVEDSELSGMDLPLRIDLLRIIQELLTNIVKHAKAKSVSVLVCKDLDFLILNIIDDGVGFSLQKAQSAGKGIG